MKDHLKERIIRSIESLSDERGYQVLDYVEFLESKYGERAAPTGILVGGALLVAFGVGLAAAVLAARRPGGAVDLASSGLAALALALVMAVIGGFLPAFRASRIQPVEAMRHRR